ncbi:hypothetical protein KTT66_06725 [Lacticaseibacillus casei]|jgi:hypothetical protein|nr:hypothetical protein [Lacticaseibacillus casei]MDG3061220.1 hypothetical protein [Lacticaseibacillus sp. BCRC 81376]QXG60477.1 hypothetical protein KTT66_06725 [Lacticaseibacillus casei]
MYMQTGHSIAGWTDPKQLLAVIADQLKPYQKDRVQRQVMPLNPIFSRFC